MRAMNDSLNATFLLKATEVECRTVEMLLGLKVAASLISSSMTSIKIAKMSFQQKDVLIQKYFSHVSDSFQTPMVRVGFFLTQCC